MALTRRRPMLFRYELTCSSRITGISFCTCCAASWPSFTSSDGLYLFLGAVILVCADAAVTLAARITAIRGDFTCIRDIALTALTPPARPYRTGYPPFTAETVPTVAGTLGGWHLRCQPPLSGA